MDKKVKITLKGDGLSYDSEISEALAGSIMAICLSPEERAMGKSVPSIISAKPTGPLKESAAEYLNRHAPKRNPDKILTLAGFLKESHHKDTFQQGEIKSLFRDAGEIVPANLGRDLKWAVSSGWIAPDPGKKDSFYITNTGMKVLQEGFPDELVKKTKGKTNIKKKVKNQSNE